MAGTSAGTATWATNVGNEFGQVLMSVITVQEGTAGLAEMAKGLVQRYSNAHVQPPKMLYVDCDCCTIQGDCKVLGLFSGWPDLLVRLDIWHFMRRLAVGCTSESHQLYGIFMSRLSSAIFQWDASDLEELHKAKRQELQLEHLSPNDITKYVTKRELALHCRRQTRGTEETTKHIETLLRLFDGTAGRDTMGIPVLDHDRIWAIWETQKRHIACLQDPDNFQLYTQTGVLVKGGVELKTYRCARGTTSLESFHLHLNRFIPGIQHITSCSFLCWSIWLHAFHFSNFTYFQSWQLLHLLSGLAGHDFALFRFQVGITCAQVYSPEKLCMRHECTF